MCVRCGVMCASVRARPISRKARSPVASNCRSGEPNWNPCVQSVHPRAWYFPSTVNTGAPDDWCHRRSSASILPAETSNSRSMCGTRSDGVRRRSMVIIVLNRTSERRGTSAPAFCALPRGVLSESRQPAAAAPSYDRQPPAPSQTTCRVLEPHLHPELHLPLGRAAEGARRARQHGGNLPCRARVDVVRGLTELRVVEDVERLDAELRREPPDPGVLDQRRVDVELPRAAQRVAP